MEWLLLGLIIYSILYFCYWAGIVMEWLEKGPQRPIIHIHNHPVQRKIYLEKIIEKVCQVYIR
jgi:hypothetical protein